MTNEGLPGPPVQAGTPLGRPLTKEPTDAQIVALLQFANMEGRCWKRVLHDAWMDGDYGVHGAYSHDLQAVRNTFGPSWLVKFKLPETVTIGNHVGHYVRLKSNGYATVWVGEGRICLKRSKT